MRPYKQPAEPSFQTLQTSQVTEVCRGHEVVGVKTIVLSTQHDPNIDNDMLHAAVIEQIVLPLVPEALRMPGFNILVNPTGRFEIGGPNGDTGLTGRKIIVDSYGGSCPHGGGAFSGKDPTKVDRSAAYMARYFAKTSLPPPWPSAVQCNSRYAIVVAKPVSVLVDTHGTGRVGDELLEGAVLAAFDLTPRGIIETLTYRNKVISTPE